MEQDGGVELGVPRLLEVVDRRADQQLLALAIPQQRVGLAAQEPTIPRLFLQALPRGGPCFPLLARAGSPARVGRGQALQLHLGVGAQQIGGNLEAVHAQGEVECVVDDVLGQVEARIEDVVPGDPAGLDAVGGGEALFADHMAREAFQVFGTELSRGSAGDAETGAGHSAGKKAHHGLLCREVDSPPRYLRV